MPKCKVVLLTEARLQLKDIAMFYKAKVGTASAKKITDKIMKELRRLEDFPELGVVPKSPMLERSGYRMLIAGEYLCFYSVEGNVVYVNQILHGSVDYVKWLMK